MSQLRRTLDSHTRSLSELVKLAERVAAERNAPELEVEIAQACAESAHATYRIASRLLSVVARLEARELERLRREAAMIAGMPLCDHLCPEPGCEECRKTHELKRQG